MLEKAAALIKRKKAQVEDVRAELPVALAEAGTGLSSAQARERLEGGWANTPVEPPTKTVRQIIRKNTLTYFNLVFTVLAVCIALVGSWADLLFMTIVLANTAIGIIQELRSKKTLDELNILNSPRARVVREGVLSQLPTAETVRDDVVELMAGDQIFADAEVISGECQVNESLITGESDEIKKRPGAPLLSGAFVVSGSVRARLTAVGGDSFVNRLTIEAKRSGKPRQSEMMRALTRLVQVIGILIIPLGVALFYNQFAVLKLGAVKSVTATVGAVIGMIPEGLYLLTSVALAVGVMRLARKKTLVHELGCIETLARVDVLCVDKTGTITENKMIVEDVELLCEDRFEDGDVRMIMADYVAAMQSDNDTMAALRRYFTGEATQPALSVLPFTSSRKYGGVSFHEDESYVLGAPEVVMGGSYESLRERVEHWSALGCRVLLLCMYDGELGGERLDGELLPIALLLLANKVRPEAPETFRYFREQGVSVRVISGDSAVTVSEVAKRAGIPNAERFIDARELKTERDIRSAAEKYTVFGRVTPEQKRSLIRAMKKAGHKVAMTGDGVNDVLALKEADCSVAMASGSEVAAQVSHIVLLESDFSRMPSVVGEGRRVINNIERSASLFLVKNIFSFFLALISMIAVLPYPVSPAQLSLVNGLTIGFPSFVLALEPNSSLVKGKFLRNVIARALPAGLTDLILVLVAIGYSYAFGLSSEQLSTMTVSIMGVVGILMLIRTCRPFNRLRIVLCAGMSVAFVLAMAFIKGFFTLSALTLESSLILILLVLLAWPCMYVVDLALKALRSFELRVSLKKRKAE